jgi:hypothetical protein
LYDTERVEEGMEAGREERGLVVVVVVVVG